MNQHNYAPSQTLQSPYVKALIGSLGLGKTPTEVRRALHTRKGDRTKGTFEWFTALRNS
jgi:hypothetical protein